MSPTLTTFLFEAANFLVLAAALGWLFFKPVRQALHDRSAKLAAEAQEAAGTLTKAEATQREIDATRAHLQEELNELRSRELEAARGQAAQLVADARRAAERELESARHQAAQMSEMQRDTLSNVAAAAAAETVGKLLQQLAGRDLQSALIESACEQLRALPPDAIAPVKVESAQPLTADQRSAVENALGHAAAGADFRTVDDLMGGVRISTGKGLIDASISGLVQFARQSLVYEMNHRANNHNPLQIAKDD
ncbi:MAG: F0F1 ATP synthase subunit delta [Pirellulales bacterium]